MWPVIVIVTVRRVRQVRALAIERQAARVVSAVGRMVADRFHFESCARFDHEAIVPRRRRDAGPKVATSTTHESLIVL